MLTKVPIEQKLASYGQNEPGLLNLAKKAEMTLKQKGLGDHIAAVALVMDVSYSMSGMFRDGTVQTVIERVMGLGLNFDDNGAIDTSYCGRHHRNPDQTESARPSHS